MLINIVHDIIDIENVGHLEFKFIKEQVKIYNSLCK